MEHDLKGSQSNKCVILCGIFFYRSIYKILLVKNCIMKLENFQRICYVNSFTLTKIFHHTELDYNRFTSNLVQCRYISVIVIHLLLSLRNVQWMIQWVYFIAKKGGIDVISWNRQFSCLKSECEAFRWMSCSIIISFFFIELFQFMFFFCFINIEIILSTELKTVNKIFHLNLNKDRTMIVTESKFWSTKQNV